ncbi:MAG: FUSC family protein, partial [Cyanobium sp. LacPavin_0920_WC12_MAG_62_9]|nr:FUSC family protein [Cyanobium sp. LacPavin_0920_WC12_MAG_62_9]
LLRQLHQAEHDLLQLLAERVGQWASIFSEGGWRLPAPPQAPMVWPQSWMDVESLFSDPRSNQASPEQLERVASRLVLCRQAQRAIEEAEQSWAGLLNG